MWRSEAAAVHELALEGGEERLGGAVVEADPGGAHRLGHPELFLDRDVTSSLYYALAGGHAVAAHDADGMFVLPGAAVGGDSITFSLYDVADASPDELNLKVIDPRPDG